VPRNRSEALPTGAQIFNVAQREHMRNEARWDLSLDPVSVQNNSWKNLSEQERQHLTGPDYTIAQHLRRHYEDLLRREQRAT